MKEKINYYQRGFLLIFLAVGFVWAKSALGKVMGGTFVSTMDKSLEKFASGNPYEWYVSFLTSFVIPNAEIFGRLVMWGEVFVAAALLGSILYVLTNKSNVYALYILLAGLIGGALLNLNYYFASAWMSPSSESLNLLMVLLQSIGIFIQLRTIQSSTK